MITSFRIVHIAARPAELYPAPAAPQLLQEEGNTISLPLLWSVANYEDCDEEGDGGRRAEKGVKSAEEEKKKKRGRRRWKSQSEITLRSVKFTLT